MRYKNFITTILASLVARKGCNMKLGILACTGLLFATIGTAKPSETIKQTVGSWIKKSSLSFPSQNLPEEEIEDYLESVLEYVQEDKVTDIGYFGPQINTKDRWMAVIQIIKQDRLRTLVLPILERDVSYRKSIQMHLAEAFSKLKQLEMCWYNEVLLDDSTKKISSASSLLESVMRQMEKKAIIQWAPAFYVATYTSTRVKSLYWMKKYMPPLFYLMEKDLTPSTRQALKEYEDEMNQEGAEDNWN